MSYDNRNSGALFRNDKKADNHPDYTGPFTGPNGEELQIAAWLRTSKAGKTYMQVKVSPPFKPKEKGQVQPQSAPQPQPEFDDDIPF